MKCVVPDCPEKANTGWMFCRAHLAKGPDAFDIMTEKGKAPVATLKGEICEVNSCGEKIEKDGHRLCKNHKDDFYRSPLVDCTEWIAFKEDKDLEAPSATPKQNEGKRSFSLVRWEFMRAIADVMTWGLQKYPAENYLGMDSQTIYDSMMRHLDAHVSGEKTDEESGKPHLWHFASNAMMWFMLEHRKETK